MSTELSTNVTPLEQVCKTIATPDFQAKIAQALPKGAADRFTRVTLTAMQLTPALATQDRGSLYNALMRAAADGLLPDGREAALVSFGGKVQYMPMVGGIVKKLGESGISIHAENVHENDFFEREFGDDARISHKPPKLGADRGALVGTYAIARDRVSGEILGREVMDRAQVEQVRKASRSGTSGPWKDWFDEMARKTVIRRLAKRLPLSEQAASVLQADEQASGFTDGPVAATETLRDVSAGPRRPRALEAVAPVAAGMGAVAVDPSDGDDADEPPAKQPDDEF